MTRKANIVDKNSKKKKERPTDSHKLRPDTKLHVKTRDFGASLTRATINLRYDTTSILKKALKQLRFFSEHADVQTSHAELLWDMRTLAIISVLTTLITFTISTARSFLLLHKNRVTLQCLSDFMLLKIDLHEIPEIKPSSLHLRHLSCKPQHVTNTTALFKVPFEGCGTIRRTNDTYIKFSNEVENSLSALNESRRVIVRRVPEFHFPFMCYYRPKYVISIQEGERREKGNDSGEQPRLEGYANQSSSAPEETSSAGKLMLCSYRAAPVVLLLLIAVYS